MTRALLLCLLLAAAPAWALEQVRLQLNWKHQFQFAGYYAAIEKGFYRAAGIEVTPVEAETGQDPIDAVLRGTVQYGVGASELALRRGRGEPVVALAAILQHSPLVLLARQDARLDSIHDLAGKRVMLMPHETELTAYLRREGIALSALQVLHHSFDTRDLIEGRVDAMSGYATDETFMLRRARFSFLTFTPRASGIDFYGDTLFTTESELRQQPARVKAFREASLQGWRYAMAHPEEIADLILAKYSRRHSREHLLFEAAEMARLMQPELVEIGYMTPGRWRHMADTYAELGMLAADASLDGFLYQPQPASLPGWIVPAFAAGGLLFAAMAALALRFARLSRRFRDEMSERQATDRRLRALQRDMTALIDATPGAAMLLDEAGRILAINHAGASRFNGDKQQITGLNIYELSTPAVAGKRREAVAQAVAERRTLTMEDRRAGRDLRNTIVPVEDEDGQIRRIAVFSEDITDRKRADATMREAYDRLQAQLEEIQALQTRLAEQAIHDSLTGLYNRRYLDETLERELSRARREGYALALVMIDLDHFKDINDSHGHKAGDEVLRALARLLRDDVRAEDVPCRYGGEEFLVLLPKMSPATATQRAEGWRRTIEAMAVPFGDRLLHVTASFGVAAYPDHGVTPDDLTQRADEALYRAKSAGRNRVVCHGDDRPPGETP